MENNRNGCKNIQKVFNSYMLSGERPERYRRGYTITKNNKVSNRYGTELTTPSRAESCETSPLRRRASNCCSYSYELVRIFFLK